jgi:DNA-binding NarL/FixJ family response regulator
MGKIKVLLAIRPKMLLDVVRHIIDQQPDMEVVGEVGDPIELLFTVRATRVEVVIITPTEEDRELETYGDLLADYPSLKIMVLLTKGNMAALCAWDSGKKFINDVGEVSFLSAVRELRC